MVHIITVVILFIGMLTHLHSDRHSKLEWNGLRSGRFGRSITHRLPNDLIRTNFEMPNQTYHRGRTHYSQEHSGQYTPRSCIRIIPQDDHWHPRESKKQITSFHLTPPPPRAERKHNNEMNPQLKLHQGIKTFYQAKYSPTKTYQVENLMQTKKRVSIRELRDTFYQDRKQSLAQQL